jgi:hypothetical protein
MTKAIRVENADTSSWKVVVQVWDKGHTDANGTAPDNLVQEYALNYPTAMTPSDLYKIALDPDVEIGAGGMMDKTETKIPDMTVGKIELEHPNMRYVDPLAKRPLFDEFRERKQEKCKYCEGYHPPEKCSRVRAIDYHLTGVIKRVELKD